MAIQSTKNREDYDGPSASADFPFDFLILDATDLKVTEVDADGNASTLTIAGGDITVSGVGDAAGGYVTRTAGALPAGYHLTLRRVRPLTQGTDLRNQGGYYPEILERSLDHLIMIEQQQQDDIDRSLKLPDTESSAGLYLPTVAQRAGMVLGFDALGAPAAAEEGAGHSALRAELAAGSADLADFAHARAGTWVSATEFTLTGTPQDALGRKLAQVDRRLTVEHQSSGTRVFGTITAVAEATDTTVTVSLDAGALLNEALAVAFGILSPGSDAVPVTIARAADKADKAVPAAAQNLAALDAAGNLTDSGAPHLVTVGSYVEVQLDLVGAVEPPSSHFIRCVAGLTGAGDYNEGKLTTESVSGSAPLIDATAVIDDAESPMNGQTVNLVETERRFMRAGSPGTLEDDALQNHNHTLNPTVVNNQAGSGGAAAGADRSTRGKTDGVVDGRSANETRPRNIGVAVYMRIK